MNTYGLPEDEQNEAFPHARLEKQLLLLNELSCSEFDLAERLVDKKLNAAMASLQQSASAIRLLLAAQSPADLATDAGVALRADLQALLDSSTHLTRLAGMMQDGFSSGREACETRTEQKIANVVHAVARHRTEVQDNAIALTEAALDKARAPSPISHASRAIERRPR